MYCYKLFVSIKFERETTDVKTQKIGPLTSGVISSHNQSVTDINQSVSDICIYKTGPAFAIQSRTLTNTKTL